MSPQRVQRKRTKGWRMPENTVYVGRGSKWGNPYKVVAQYKNGPFDVYQDDWFLGRDAAKANTANASAITDPLPEHDEDLCSRGKTLCHECYAAGADLGSH